MFGYKRILDVSKALFINIFTLVIQFIPRTVSGYAASFLGFCAFVLLKKRRKAIVRVLKVVEPEADNSRLRRLACRILINYANNFADFLRLYHMNSEELIGIVESRGLENLKKVLDGNKGAILLSAHIGNWEVGSNFIAAYGFPFVGVVESAGPGDILYRLFQRYREHFGMQIVSLEDSSVIFKLRRLIKKAYVVGLVGDRDIAGTGIEVTFFGRRAIFPQGAAFLSLVSDCPILPAFFLRDKSKHKKVYYVYVEKPIKYNKTGNRKEDINNLTQIVARRIEAVVRKYPDQWFSFPPPWEIGLKDKR